MSDDRQEFSKQIPIKLDHGTFIVLLQWDKNQYNSVSWIDWAIYESCGDDCATPDIPLFSLKDGPPVHMQEASERMEGLKSVVEGFIKWDGCCQWGKDNVHTDDSQHLKNICTVISQIYDICRPIFNREDVYLEND